MLRRVRSAYMINSNLELPIGYSSVGRECLAAVVTFLEMTSAPQSKSSRKLQPPYELAPMDRSDMAEYRALFQKVGENWLWNSRLTMPDEELNRILRSPLVEIFALKNGTESIGLLELDFREPGECELAFFGLIPTETGKGLGRALMNAATEMAWTKPIRRFWVHTCTLDHPAALEFYVRSGFRPYAFQVEVQPDPRLTGHLPRSAAPHIPLIEDEPKGS